jgi:hypothetical protein
MFPSKFRFIWQSSFKGEDFLIKALKVLRDGLTFQSQCESLETDPLTSMAATGNACF